MPVLQIRNQNGGSWTVHAEFHDGSFEEISGFATENDANLWIATKFQGSSNASVTFGDPTGNPPKNGPSAGSDARLRVREMAYHLLGRLLRL
jgi:hypothetical protein